MIEGYVSIVHKFQIVGSIAAILLAYRISPVTMLRSSSRDWYHPTNMTARDASLGLRQLLHKYIKDTPLEISVTRRTPGVFWRMVLTGSIELLSRSSTFVVKRWQIILVNRPKWEVHRLVDTCSLQHLQLIHHISPARQSDLLFPSPRRHSSNTYFVHYWSTILPFTPLNTFLLMF